MSGLMVPLLTSGLEASVGSRSFGLPRSLARVVAQRRQKQHFLLETSAANKSSGKRRRRRWEIDRNNLNNLGSLTPTICVGEVSSIDGCIDVMELLALQKCATQEKAEAKQAKLLSTPREKSLTIHVDTDNEGAWRQLTKLSRKHRRSRRQQTSCSRNDTKR